jgi:diacylglycerol kinase
MKPDWLDPEVWTVSDLDRETGLAKFIAAFAVFVIWLILIYVYITALTP